MKKRIQNTLGALLIITTLFTSCEKNEDKFSLGESPLKFQVATKEAVLTMDNEEEEALTFTFDDSQISEEERQRLVYYLQWDIAGNQFKGANQKEFQATNNTFSFKAKELNTIMSPIYGAGKEVDLELRLYVTNPEGSAASSYYSPKQSFKVKTYRTNYIVISGFLPNPTELIVLLKELYLILLLVYYTVEVMSIYNY